MSRRYVISVDPATTTGLAVVAHENGDLTAAYTGVVKMGTDRNVWIRTALDELKACKNECAVTRGLVVLVEDWARHLAYSTAKKLAQLQQVWIDAASLLDVPVIMVPVLQWQVAAGINKVRDKRDGKGARKKACIDWVMATYGVEDIDHNIADALCMAAVWIHRREAA